MFSLTHRERKVLLFIGILIFCGAILRFFNVKITNATADVSEKVKNAEIFPVNINTATREDLEKLPGIGPEIANRIVKYRTNHGLFISFDDLKKVKGIGDKKLKVMKDYIAL